MVTMKKSYEIVGQDGQVFWRIALSGCSSVWDALTIQVSETVPSEMPDFQDHSEALLLNTIERWCIINSLIIREAVTLTKGGDGRYDDVYQINGERVYLCFKWMVQARFKRRRSGRVRIHNFEVHSQDRQGAIDMAHRQYKGATLLDLLSLTPCGFGIGYWKDRPGFPNIDPDIVSRLEMPENL
jgi:hypothetical protein